MAKRIEERDREERPYPYSMIFDPLRRFMIENPSYSTIIMYIIEQMTTENVMKYSSTAFSEYLHINRTDMTKRMKILHEQNILHKKGKEVFLNPALACKFLTKKQQRELMDVYEQYCKQD